MTPSASYPASWPDPLDLLAEPRAWASLFWPIAQVTLGAMHLSLLTAGYGVALSFIPLAVGLPMLSLVIRAAWWVAEGEARIVAYLAGQASTPVPSPPPAQGFLLGLGDLLSMREAWTRPLGLLLTLPLGVVGLAVVTTMFGLAFGFLAAGLAGAFGVVQVSFDGWNLPPTRGVQQALWILGGLAGLLGTLHLAFAWIRLHAWIWRRLR